MSFRYVREIGPEICYRDLAHGLAMGWGEQGVTVKGSAYVFGLIWGNGAIC